MRADEAEVKRGWAFWDAEYGQAESPAVSMRDDLQNVLRVHDSLIEPLVAASLARDYTVAPIWAAVADYVAAGEARSQLAGSCDPRSDAYMSACSTEILARQQVDEDARIWLSGPAHEPWRTTPRAIDYNGLLIGRPAKAVRSKAGRIYAAPAIEHSVQTNRFARAKVYISFLIHAASTSEATSARQRLLQRFPQRVLNTMAVLESARQPLSAVNVIECVVGIKAEYLPLLALKELSATLRNVQRSEPGAAIRTQVRGGLTPEPVTHYEHFINGLLGDFAAIPLTSRPKWGLRSDPHVFVLARVIASGSAARYDLRPVNDRLAIELERGGFEAIEKGSRLTASFDLDAIEDVSTAHKNLQRLNTDDAWCLFYVLECLAGAEDGQFVKVSTDDIIRQIGWDRNRTQRRHARARVLHCLRTIAALQTATEMDPSIRVPPPWHIVGLVRDPELRFWDGLRAPIEIVLEANVNWLRALNEIMVLVPGAERVSAFRSVGGETAIRSGQPRGSWARSIALGLYMRCFMPGSELRGQLTRRTLLSTFPPVAGAQYLDRSAKIVRVKRIKTIWREAILDLADIGILGDSKEVERVRKMNFVKSEGNRLFQDWLDETLELTPGPRFKHILPTFLDSQ